MRRLLLIVALFATLGTVQAQAEAPAEGFRRANESASRGRGDDALSVYDDLARGGSRSPALYWNWAQVATTQGKKGEALWALLRAQELAPRDASLARQLERLRGELGLDPSEISLGALGDLRRAARRFRFDALAIVVLSASIALLFVTPFRRALAAVLLLAGLLLLAPYAAVFGAEARGVVVQKDAPLVDTPRNEGVALANLREGEVVPLLGEEGEFIKIQDASGARGFAHKSDVRRIGVE